MLYMVYNGRKMIDNTAFFSVMAPYMPLRPFPGLEERGKRRILVTRNSSLLFPYNITCVSLPFQKMDGRNTFYCRSFPCFPQELPFPGLPQTGMKRPSGTIFSWWRNGRRSIPKNVRRCIGLTVPFIPAWCNMACPFRKGRGCRC